MKIKIKNTVSGAKAIHKKGTIVDVSAEEASRLIHLGHAEKHVEAAPQQQQQQQQQPPPAVTPTKQDIFEALKGANKKSLLEVQKNAQELLAKDANNQEAKLTLEVISELLK